MFHLHCSDIAIGNLDKGMILRCNLVLLVSFDTCRVHTVGWQRDMGIPVPVPKCQLPV